MINYGKMSQNAVSAVSYLASCWQDPPCKVSSSEIAEKRNLPRPIVAKILTSLSHGGLIKGTPGPGGGYWLARPPAAITLWDVAAVFERADPGIMCPLGPGWCGHGPRCPLHDSIVALKATTEAFLKAHDFGQFTSSPCAPADS
jgi:Rrf2 family protein